jgi:hypothetical protein
MPKREGSVKEEFLSTRVTFAIKDSVFNEAQTEGLTPSEWLRNLVVKELKERQALPTGITISERYAGARNGRTVPNSL